MYDTTVSYVLHIIYIYIYTYFMYLFNTYPEGVRLTDN